MTNAERQAKWRERQKRRITELEAKLAKLERGSRPKRRRKKPLHNGGDN